MRTDWPRKIKYKDGGSMIAVRHIAVKTGIIAEDKNGRRAFCGNDNPGVWQRLPRADDPIFPGGGDTTWNPSDLKWRGAV